MSIDSWKSWANSLKKNTCALYLASRDARVPLSAKILIVLVVGYALSPIDLIPDFIPVIGYLDDLFLLPMGIWLAIRIVPRQVWEECRMAAVESPSALPRNRRAAAVIVVIWLLAIVACLPGVWRIVT